MIQTFLECYFREIGISILWHILKIHSSLRLKLRNSHKNKSNNKSENAIISTFLSLEKPLLKNM